MLTLWPFSCCIFPLTESWDQWPWLRTSCIQERNGNVCLQRRISLGEKSYWTIFLSNCWIFITLWSLWNQETFLEQLVVKPLYWHSTWQCQARHYPWGGYVQAGPFALIMSSLAHSLACSSEPKSWLDDLDPKRLCESGQLWPGLSTGFAWPTSHTLRCDSTSE